VLYDQGYILKYKFEDTANNQGVIKIALKYNPVSKIPAIREIKRYSKPGLRKYSSADKLPRVLNGLGVAIVSTSHGVITDKKARELNVGGEVLCFVS
jgi:small subunit ribosomal protein S8